MGRYLGTALFSALTIVFFSMPVLAVKVAAPSSTAMTIQEAWHHVLHDNPSLKATKNDIQAMQGQQTQANLIPNPTLSYTSENIEGSGIYHGMASAENTWLVNQTIEWAGQRQARKRVADARYDASLLQYNSYRAALFNQLAQAFLTYAERKSQWQWSQQAVTVSQRTAITIQRRVKAGRASKLELKAAQIVLSDHRLAEKAALQALESAKYVLMSLWNGSPRGIREVDITSFGLMPLAPYATYEQHLLQNPELSSSQQALKVTKAQIKLADKEAFPTITAGIGIRYLRQTNDRAYVAQVSLPIPLFDRNQGNRASAKANYYRAENDYQNKFITLKTTLFSLHQQAQQAKREMTSLEQAIIPKAKQAIKLAQEGYLRGRFSYLDLLNAQQKLLDEQAHAIQAAFTYRKTWVLLQVISGQLPEKDE